MTRPPRTRPAGRLLVVLVAAVVGAASLANPAPTSAAVNSTQWTAMDPPDPLAPNGALGGVSCVGDLCMAVGSWTGPDGTGTPLAQVRGADGSWTTLVVPAPAPRDAVWLSAVSCAATDRCVAVGSLLVDRLRLAPFATEWDGRRWATTQTPALTGSLAAVSCPTTDRCMAVGQQGEAPGTALALRWDGQSWSTTPTAPLSPLPNSSELSAVSCGSAASCLATGFASRQGPGALAQVWDGHRWSVAELPYAVQSLAGVSCPAAGSCVAIGRGGSISDIRPVGVHWTQGVWTLQTITTPVDLPLDVLAAVSCSSMSACRAVGAAPKPSPSLESQLAAVAWNGQQWSVERLPTPTNSQSGLRAISCPTTGTCTTVGSFNPIDPVGPYGGLSRTLAEHREAGGSWKIDQTPDPRGAVDSHLADVSCPAVGSCIAVGAAVDQDGYRVAQSQVWDGVTWNLQPIVTPDDISPRHTAVSCSTAVSCMAVGSRYQNGLLLPWAQRWDGQRWSQQPIPLPVGMDNAEVFDVSCATPTACLAVGQGSATPNSAIVARWNGLTWIVETVGIPSSNRGARLAAVSCPTVVSCTAVGTGYTDGGEVTFAVRWTGGRVDVETITSPSWVVTMDPEAVSCDSEDNCMTVGAAYNAATAYRRTTAGWTAAPTPTPAPETAVDLHDVSCVAGACVAVGSHRPPTANHDHPLIETWDGRSWTVRTIVNEDPARGRLLGVSCTVRCVVVGQTASTTAVIGPIPLADPTAAATIPPVSIPPPGIVAAKVASGYWALSSDGTVHPFGAAPALGNTQSGVVDLEPTPTGKGYWTLNRNGVVQPFGNALKLGDVNPATLGQGEEPASLSASPTGRGYWVFTNRGRVIAFGDAPFLGDMRSAKLNGPVLGSVATPSGLGYYMVASDGGIFAFGDAAFAGSMGGKKLNAPVQSLVPDSDGKGYWLVASDGGIFAFDAPFRGSMGDEKLNKPVVGMVRYGDGYLMVGADGGIFNFSKLPFSGSLGDKPPTSPVVAVAALP